MGGAAPYSFSSILSFEPCEHSIYSPKKKKKSMNKRTDALFCISTCSERLCLTQTAPFASRFVPSTALLSFITLSLTAVIIFSVCLTDHCVALPRKWCPVGTGPCPVPEPCQTCLETPRGKSESHHRAERSCAAACTSAHCPGLTEVVPRIEP